MFGGPSLKLFTIRGIPIGAHWSLFIALALFAYNFGGLAGVSLGVGLFTSVLLHELGHAIVAQRRRVPIAGIDLHLFGGVAKMTAPPRSPKDEIAIAAAGPLVSLMLGLTGVGLSFALPAYAPFFVWLGGANLVLFAFNLLPALPMDGGRVLRAWLADKNGLVKGTEKAVKVSRAIAVTLGVAGLVYNPWWVALAAFIWFLGSAEIAQMKRHETLRKMGYRSDDIDPWARYDKACDAPADVEVLPPEQDSRAYGPAHPQNILAQLLGRAGPAPRQRRQERNVKFARDAFGRIVVQTDDNYRW